MSRTLSKEEATAMLKDYHIEVADEIIQRCLYFGLIEGKSLSKSNINWGISEHEILRMINAVLQEENNELKQENHELKKDNCKLWKQNHELRISIGLK